MDTRKMASEYRFAYWTQVMRERSESGLNVKMFCANAGINPNTYFYWQKKLRESASSEFAIMLPDSTQDGLMQASFAEVRLLENQTQQQHATTESSGSLLMEIAGVKLTADCNYPAEKLSYLLRELVNQC